MKSNSYRVILVSLLMIFSSLAGCLGGDDDITEDVGSVGTVMVSTYHVGELVKAVGGDRVTVDYMSQDNIPVHDYEPSAADLIRLQASDLFFYHGLGLEPWVDSTISSLGDDAPTSIGTHAMPGDEATLDYEGMLVTELCELLSEGPYDGTILAMGDVTPPEIHAEYLAHTLSFPEMEDDHDDHGEDDHDDHGEDDHDDHGDEDDHGDDDHDDHDEHDHSDHGHASPEETIENPAGCPADSVISIFHMEEGEYTLEFEEAEDMHEFNMAVLKMGGGHAHHHHGHGSGPFEWAGIFSISDASHTWTMEKVDGSYADPSMRVVIIPTDTPTEETMHSLEGGVEALIEGDCTIVEDGESMTPVDGGSCFEWHVGTGDISTFTIDTSGMSGFAAYTAHSPYEFEATQHYLKDSAGNDVEHVAEEGGGGHGDHGDHGDDHGDDDHDDHDDHGDDHDDHDDHDEEMTPEDVVEGFDSNNDSHISWDEFVVMMESMDDDHDDHDDHGDDDHGDDDHGDDDHGDDDHGDDDNGDDDHGDDHDDHDDHDPLEEAMEEYMMDMLMSMFNESDADGDTLLSMDELDNFIESIEHIEDDLDSALTEIMISAFDEDDDGLLSMSEFVSMMEAMDDDHDDHGEDDHDDHGDDDHDDHGDDDHNETEMMELMFHMFDTNGDESIDASELDMLMEMGEDEHDEHAGYLTIHIEAEGEYGFALPHDVEFYVLMGEDGHDDHDDHGDDHDDHDDHDEGHDDEEMVCYDMSTHTVDASYTTESDCEAAGLMWTAANSGPGGDDHDDHSDEETLNYDPHSWLDPVAYKVQLNIVMEGLIAAFPSAEDDFRANGAAFSAELDSMDDAYEAAFGENGTCAAGGHEKTVAANHNAYSYIAVRYDIQFVTVHGLDPEGEPSPEDVAKVVEHINEEGITVLYVEEYTDPSSVGSIVQETGVTIQYLYTMEMAPIDSNDDYLSLMNKNLDNLVAGMGC